MLSMKTIGTSIVFVTFLIILSACTSPIADPNNSGNISLHRTGIPELDEIIEITLKGGTDKLRTKFEFTQTTCSFLEGLGGPPKCLINEEEGTPVEVLPFLGPEGHFIRKDEIASWEGFEVSELFAVYKVSSLAYTEENYPAGEYAIVFIENKAGNTTITLQVTQGRIVRIDYGFGYPPEIRQADVDSYLVPPVNNNQ